jgi:hypothetical protein
MNAFLAGAPKQGRALVDKSAACNRYSHLEGFPSLAALKGAVLLRMSRADLSPGGLPSGSSVFMCRPPWLGFVARRPTGRGSNAMIFLAART